MGGFRCLVGRCFQTLAALSLLTLGAGSALAQCLPMVQADPWVIPAALPKDGDVRLSYLGHSSFLIESAEGVAAVTDYNGWIRPPTRPDIVTMNNAHDTHYTDVVDPEIQLALPDVEADGGHRVHTEVHDLVAVVAKPGHHQLFEREAGVVGADGIVKVFIEGTRCAGVIVWLSYGNRPCLY